MDVATPTADCLNLVYNLLAPVIMKGNSKTSLSHQEVSSTSLLFKFCNFGSVCIDLFEFIC